MLNTGAPDIPVDIYRTTKHQKPAVKGKKAICCSMQYSLNNISHQEASAIAVVRDPHFPSHPSAGRSDGAATPGLLPLLVHLRAEEKTEYAWCCSIELTKTDDPHQSITRNGPILAGSCCWCGRRTSVAAYVATVSPIAGRATANSTQTSRIGRKEDG